MRHNQNARRMRGGRNGGGHNNHHNNGQQRRVNPRVQTFDSNGPEVRIRGTAFQINEKYVTLARDAAAAGDRVLAESYLQHAEHYQRFINETTEEFNQYQQQQQQAQGHQPQPVVVDGHHNGAAAPAAVPEEGMNDLDQGFLVGNRSGNNVAAAEAAAPAPAPATEQPQEQPRHRNRQAAGRRGSESDAT